MNETETTIRIDMSRFPREYWTSEEDPFHKIEGDVLEDVYDWVQKQIPHFPCAVELDGWAPAPIIARVVKALCDTGNVDNFYMHKPRCARCKVW